MLWVHIIAAIAAFLGIVSMGLGISGYRSLNFIQGFLGAAGYFDNPTYGNLTADAWRSGYLNAMSIFLAFGLLALVAAVGLLQGRRWARYLWLVLTTVLTLVAVPDLSHDIAARIWLLLSATLLGLSWFALRNFHVSTSTPS